MSADKFDPKSPGQHGRFIDETIGTLSGEGAGQNTKQTVSESLGPPSGVMAVAYPAAAEAATYYDQPVLQTPVWIWSVPLYFYIGGTAGAALTLASAAQRADGVLLGGLIHKCRWIGAIGLGLGSGFLIYDLGRPSRFLNMLRVFRPSSPLNVGSWLLAAGGTLSGTAAVFCNSSGWIRKVADVAGHGAGLLGMPLAGYTGVVLADTAVPAWQEARRMLPVLFIGSAMAGTASLLEIMDLAPREEAVARPFGILGKAAELAGAVAMEREACRIPHVARPFHRGISGALWKLAKTLSLASLVTSLLPGRSKRKHQVAGVLGSLGAVAIRFAIMEIGRQSASDPRATFQMHRAGHGGAEATGKPAIAAPPGKRGAIAPAAPAADDRTMTA